MSGAWFQDAAITWRGLIGRPFHVIVTITMLALALGASITAFGLFYGYDLRPLPFRHESQLVMVRETMPKVGLDQPITSPAMYRAIVRSVPSVEAAGLWTFLGSVAAKIDHVSLRVRVARVTPSFFTTLGASPVLGKLLDLASGQRGGPPEGMISWQFWQNAYGGNADAIDRTIRVSGVDYRVVGVLPREFGFNSPTDFFVSYVPPRTGRAANNLNDYMVARLSRGVTVAQFDARLKSVLRAVESRERPEYAARLRANGTTLDARPIRNVMLLGAEVGIMPQLVLGTALFLVLLAIANAGNLALVRNRARMPDFALRRILGARRGRILFLLMLEYMPIFLFSGVIASLLAAILLQALNAKRAVFYNPPLDIATGWPVYLFGWCLAAVSITLIVAIPFGQIAAQRLAGQLSQGRATLSVAMKRIQRTLGVVQITLAFALLVGGAVLALSLNALLNQPLGFKPQHRIVTSVLLPQGSNDPTALIRAVHSVRALPSTVSVGGAGFWAYPFTENNYDSTVARTTPRAPRKLVREVAVTSGYFHVLGIAIRRGQRFDRAALIGTGRREILVSPSLAHALFGTTDAVGRMANLLFDDYRIIGIAAPVVWQATPAPGVHGVVYVPAVTMTKAYKSFPFTGATVLVHVRGSIPAAITATQRAIERAVPGAVVTEIRPYSAVIDTFVGFRIVIASLVAGFALLALIIAALGVYAVNAFVARARLPEFGMRAMLGASPARLLRLALTDATWLLGFGLAGGAIGGYVLLRAMSSLLFHQATIAPPVFAVSAVLIAAIVFAAAWRPAARAAKMPVQTLLDAS